MVPKLITLLVSLTVVFPVAAEEKSATPQKIRTVTIQIKEIFDDPDSGFLYSTANSIKVQTKERVVRRELLFKEGDTYDPVLLKESERNLRNQRYLRKIKITPTVDGEFVDIKVEAQDTWTLIPFLAYSSGTGQENRAIGIAESNLAGLATRVEGRYQERDNRTGYSAVYDDPQFLGTLKRFSAAYLDRNDGTISSLEFGTPFRSLLQDEGWSAELSTGDTVGRLYENGEEEYIFRQNNERFGVRYTVAGPGSTGSRVASSEYSGIYQGVDILGTRFSVGYDYISDRFEQADADDYEDMDLDPNEVSNDPARLATNRRYSGPVISFQRIHPNYISMNYIDRFDRVEDYNLGTEWFTSVQAATRTLGSSRDAFLFSYNRSRGWQYSPTSFLRGEAGLSTRMSDGGLDNSVLRGELKYYNVLGDVFIGDRFFGRHTFAASFFLDFGDDFDRDRQFTVGADNALRGYDANTFEGDKRLVLNLEERTHLYDDILKLFSLGTAVFTDVGGASRDSLSSIVSDDLFADVGVGLRIGFPRSSGGAIIRLDMAVPLRDGPDGSGAFEPRFIFGAGQLFGSKLRSETVGAENASVGVGFDR